MPSSGRGTFCRKPLHLNPKGDAVSDKANELPDASAEEVLEKLGQVPTDFPRTAIPGAVPGMTPKLLLVRFAGRCYLPGCSPPEIVQAYEVCMDLAQQLAVKAVESKAGKRSHMSEEAILDQYLPRLIATRWVSELEARWVLRRVAALLNWPVPPAAKE